MTLFTLQLFSPILGLLAWIFDYPLFPALYVFIVIVALNRDGFGMHDLFWNENRLKQFLIGAFAAALVAQLLVIRYLLGEPCSCDTWRTILFWQPSHPANAAKDEFHGLAVFLWLYP